MGFIRGSNSFSRFRVTRPLPGDYMEQYPIRIMRHAFRNLDDASEEERSIGWVNILDMYDSRNAARDAFKEPYLALSLRVDVRKVPETALKQHCREEEDRIKEGEELEFVPKKRREEIRETVKKTLLRRAIPRSQTYDMLWDIKSGTVFFGALSNRICGEFQEYFFKTFDLLLSPLFPYALARGILEDADLDPGLLEDLRPSSLTEGRA